VTGRSKNLLNGPYKIKFTKVFFFLTGDLGHGTTLVL